MAWSRPCTCLSMLILSSHLGANHHLIWPDSAKPRSMGEGGRMGWAVRRLLHLSLDTPALYLQGYTKQRGLEPTGLSLKPGSSTYLGKLLPLSE